jgi:hypothetical protein
MIMTMTMWLNKYTFRKSIAKSNLYLHTFLTKFWRHLSKLREKGGK